MAQPKEAITAAAEAFEKLPSEVEKGIESVKRNAEAAREEARRIREQREQSGRRVR